MVVRRRSARARRVAPWWVLIGGGAALAAVFGPLSRPAAVAVLLAGATVLILAAWGNDAAHPTFSLLLDPVLDTYPGRFVGWLLWLATGRWLVTRR